MTKHFNSSTGEDEYVPSYSNDRHLERPLPSSKESEQVVLGAILLDSRILIPVSMALAPDDFYSASNRYIYGAMLALHKQNKPIEPILLGEQLKKDGLLDAVGGVTGITSLAHGMPHFTQVDEYVKVIKDKADLREIVRVCNEITGAALSEESHAADVRASASIRLAVVGDVAGSAPQSVKEIWDDVQRNFDAWQNDEKPVGVPTGIPELDACLRYGGFTKGDFTFIAARPSVGKSALMLQLASHAAAMHVPTEVFTLEMAPRDLFMRTLPPRSGVKNFAITPYTIRRNDEARRRLVDAGNQVAQLPLFFDGSSMKLDRLISRAEYAVTRLGVKYILLDYLQLLQANVKNRRRDQEYEEISATLKAFALQYDLPVVCLAQLNRGSEKDDRRPEMDDIREAGCAEQDADIVILPYREIPRRKKLMTGRRRSVDDIVDDAIDEQNPVVKISLYIAKQRNGKANIEVPVDFDMDYQRFMSSSMWYNDRLQKME